MNPLLELAFDEAHKARFLAPPNPWVGCVLAKNGRIIGRGHTQPIGGAHAEVMALAQAGKRAQGASAFVTLEPCAHQGRTPPCTKALIQAGVTNVHVGVLDPDPRVSGKGMRDLQAAGLNVTLEPKNQAITDHLRPYLHKQRTQRPYVVLKSACSLDGRVAAADGSSQWISCQEARRDAHLLRDESQAICIGSGTALADRPSLTIRHLPQRSPTSPLRILLDRSGRVPQEGPLFDETLGKTRIHRGDLSSLLDQLGSEGCLQLLVEGGPTLHSAFLEANLVDRLVVYVGSKLIGHKGHPLARLPIDTLDKAITLQLCAATTMGSSVRLDYTTTKSLTDNSQSSQWQPIAVGAIS